VTDSNDDAVPKLPRGRGLTLSRPQLIRILGLIALLAFLLVMQKPCAEGVSRFVTSYGSGSARGSGAGSSELDRYEHLRPGMSEAETRAVIERARLKAGSGSAVPTGSGANAP
jgi:hypothetical protein